MKPFLIFHHIFVPYVLILLRYATVQQNEEKPEAPTRRRKRSTKSLSVPSNTQPDPMEHQLDSPYPDRPTRSNNIFAPKRPPRRASSSSLIEQQK